MGKGGKGTRDNPGVVAWPPAIYAGCFAAGLALDLLWPAPFIGGVALQLAVGLPTVLAGGLLALWGALTFARAGTNVPPHLPALKVVAAGPYRFTRNSMYLGLALIHAGLAVAIDSAWILVLLVPALLVIDRGVIAREERYLAAKFGDEYRALLSRVRRWL